MKSTSESHIGADVMNLERGGKPVNVLVPLLSNYACI